MSVEAPSEAQRQQLLRALEQHRRRLDEVLSPGTPVPARLARMGAGGFPRSHTIRLILSEPLLLAGLSALTMRLLGPRLLRLLPLAGAVAKAVHALLQPAPGTSHELHGGRNDQVQTGARPRQGQ